jgi:aconitate hydratase
VLPLEFADGATRKSLGLTGFETFAIEGLGNDLKPKARLTVKAGSQAFGVIVRIDTPEEMQYYKNGGILPYVLRQLVRNS